MMINNVIVVSDVLVFTPPFSLVLAVSGRVASNMAPWWRTRRVTTKVWTTVLSLKYVTFTGLFTLLSTFYRRYNSSHVFFFFIGTYFSIYLCMQIFVFYSKCVFNVGFSPLINPKTLSTDSSYYMNISNHFKSDK